MNNDLKREHQELLEEIRIGSLATSDMPITEFFNLFSKASAENGDTPDLEYCPVLKESVGGYRLDGYAFDFSEENGAESGDFYIAVCDYRQDQVLTTVNNADIDKAVNGVIRFFKSTAEKKFILNLEEASPAYQLAVLLHQLRSKIRRLRVILLTNGHLRLRKNVFEPRDLDGVFLHVNVLDIERYSKITSIGREQIEIDFEDGMGGSIECLPAFVDDTSYKSYLFAIPGIVLANIFSIFGNRLLEQNVRTFLQAKTKVNKGILNTIAKEPGMFFAYNNGVTATASEVDTCRLPNGALAINKIRDFQIVNGGQTTASLLYAKDEMKLSLDHVHIQVKLSVVGEERLGEIVPKISEYANTQNKVSIADLASNSPAQIRIERLSKEIQAPQRAGELHSSKWFYERARGQYKSLFAYKTKSEKTKLELVYPKSQVIDKTDLGKFELSFDGMPHIVSLGAQKCFAKYSELIMKKNILELTDVWFKRAIAKSILFKTLDRAVANEDWYRANKAGKSQTITYTLAACADGFRACGYQIDLDRIWRDQEVSEQLLSWLLKEAKKVHSILNNNYPIVGHISEFAKREFCWTTYIRGKAGQPSQIDLRFGVALEEYLSSESQGKKEGKFNQQVDFDIALTQLMSRAAEFRILAEKAKLASPNNMSALNKLASGKNFSLTSAEKNALKYLLERLEVEY